MGWLEKDRCWQKICEISGRLIVAKNRDKYQLLNNWGRFNQVLEVRHIIVESLPGLICSILTGTEEPF